MLALPLSQARIYFHLLAFVLIAGAPALGWYTASRIKAEPSSGARLLGYRAAVGLMTLAAAGVFLLVPPMTFFEMQIQNRGVAWLPSRELISALAVALVLLTALPVFLARKSGPFQVDFRRQFDQFRHLLPRTRQERLWFAAALGCAGICEEVLYRGYLLHYLHVFPWQVNVATALAISCAVFGSVHLYRGFGGVLQTVLLALGLCVLFLSTRSLLPPMVLHLMIDLSVLIVLPEALPAAE
jgi:membrane protease YdiL (CAAX protease family)